MDSELFTVFLPLTLALMMMGLGLHLRPADFYRLTLHPKVIHRSIFTVSSTGGHCVPHLPVFKFSAYFRDWFDARCSFTRWANVKPIDLFI